MLKSANFRGTAEKPKHSLTIREGLAVNALEYASELIRFDSRWYLSNVEIADYAEQTLRSLHFETERIDYTDEDGLQKANVVARRGSGSGGLAYFGHTDVVTTTDWSITEHGPFEPIVRNNRLYGRGSTDMKGSIACMLAAVARLGDEAFTHPVYISCSSDEEVNHRGAIEIAERSEIYRELVAGGACGIVGEPTRLNVVYAHKGGVRVTATSRGVAAHSSTREGTNANWAMIPFLAEMKAIRDETESDERWLDHEFDPPSICLNLTVNDFTKAVNVTAPQSVCTFGFRPMPDTDIDGLLDRMGAAAEKSGIEFKVENQNPAFRRSPDSPFMTECVELIGSKPPQSVAYGTEASNFPQIENLLVLGPGDIAQAHKSDEWVSLEQLECGTQMYADLIRRFCM